MTGNRPAHAVIPVGNLNDAIDWREGTLGFPPGQHFIGGVFNQAGNGTLFQLYESANAGKNPATLMGFLTTDIESDVADHKSRVVVFEDYDMDDIKTVDSIATIEGARRLVQGSVR